MNATLTTVSSFREFTAILRSALLAAYRDNCFGIAKGVAYSALLSFFPVLTTVTAILVQANASAVSRSLSSLVFEVVPPGTENAVLLNFTERGQRPGWLLIGASLLSVWAASGVMMSLMEGFRNAYNIPKGRPFLKQRGMAALLVCSTGLPLILASAMIVSGSRLEVWVFTAAGVLDKGASLGGWISYASEILRVALALGAIISGTCLLYLLGPNHSGKRRDHEVLPGAIVATVLWWGATTVFAWYVRNIANYNVLYGSIGAAIALLVWMYLLSIIALIGCEFNVAVDRGKKSRIIER